MLKHYKKFLYSFVPLYVLFLIIGLVNIYYSGLYILNSNIAEITKYVNMVLAVGLFFPMIFFMIHYYFYRDKTIKDKLIIASGLFIFAVLSAISYYVDNAIVYLIKKRLLSFVTIFIFGGLTILYISKVIK